MSADFKINLDGIPDERWREKEERCADCRQLLEAMRDDDGSEMVPLLLWRNQGHEMLRLCWPCATKRWSAIKPT
jgi:uncharacterized protein with PIN domain